MNNFFIQGEYNIQAAMCAILENAVYKGKPTIEAVPIGSVEWTKEYAQSCGVSLPMNLTYPHSLKNFLGREGYQQPFGSVPEDWFVKPIWTKEFSGGIKRELTENVPYNKLVWSFEPVKFIAEWRCYVLDGKIVGVSQYGEDEDMDLDLTIPNQMLEAWSYSSSYPIQPAGWALDVGMLDDGRIVLVEVNDGWALGYYPGCNRKDYLNVISARWKELTQEKEKVI